MDCSVLSGGEEEHMQGDEASGTRPSSAAPGIQLRLLRDTRHGGAAGQPQQVAAALARFISGAKHSLQLAVYDFRLSDTLGAGIVAALRDRARHGVQVQVVYDQPRPAPAQFNFTALGADPAPPGTAEYLAGQLVAPGIELRPLTVAPTTAASRPAPATSNLPPDVPGVPISASHLMHHKYLIRDAGTARAAVWTGSANLTDDAFTVQENNVLLLRSAELAAHYQQDFSVLWNSRDIVGSGVGAGGQVALGETLVEVRFAPGEGAAIEARLTELIAGATRRIWVSSMVLTSRAILDALAAAALRVPVFGGVYDGTQMRPIVSVWKKSPASADVLASFTAVSARLSGKRSAPYSPGGLHDLMHNKLLVCDDTVATGSFNLSRNATFNAENSLLLHSPLLADRYARYVAALARTYHGN
jgi:phosphatidylserine/phosphatidylglycerophosphate/cardiolipin synthase-like enzyme